MTAHLSWSMLRERWKLFAGTILTVAVAVGITQASLLALVTAATAQMPAGLSEAEQLIVRDGYDGAVSLLGITVGLAFFVSIFVIGATFSFTVAQRHKAIALLRLVGAGRLQVRGVLMTEAIIIGLLGTVIGIALGILVAKLQDDVLRGFGFVPSDFRTEWHGWIVAVSVGIGVVVSLLASWLSARRASKIRPLDALNDGSQTDKVMTASRWVAGGIGIFGGIAMALLSPVAAADGRAALALGMCVFMVSGLSAWSPLVVPAIARLIAGLFLIVAPSSPIRELVAANLRMGVRRTAAMAAPMIVLTGLVTGLAGSINSTATAAHHELQNSLASDVIALSDKPLDDLLKQSGVPVVSSTEIEAVAHVQASDYEESPLSDTTAQAKFIDPAKYVQTHNLNALTDGLRKLSAHTVALDPDLAEMMRVKVGDSTTITVDGHAWRLDVAAIIPTNFVAQPSVWLSSSLLKDVAGSALGARQTSVKLEDKAQQDRLLDFLRDHSVDAQTTASWIAQANRQAGRANSQVLTVILGLSVIFTMIAIVNAIIIATVDRQREFAILSLSGLTRMQVGAVALSESAVTIATGLILGALAATGTILGMNSAASQLVGQQITEIPWLALFGCVAVVTILTILTTIASVALIIRQSPIEIAADRE